MLEGEYKSGQQAFKQIENGGGLIRLSSKPNKDYFQLVLIDFPMKTP